MSDRPMWIWPAATAWFLRAAVDYATRATMGGGWRLALSVAALGAAAWCALGWRRSTRVARVEVALDGGRWGWTSDVPAAPAAPTTTRPDPWVPERRPKGDPWKGAK